jgi:hypothetical protein
LIQHFDRFFIMAANPAMNARVPPPVRSNAPTIHRNTSASAC